jgi:hypothetical protein
LVDYDLVLTAGHCLRLLALDDFSVVFDYYYTAPGKLALSGDSIFRPSAIVSERRDAVGTQPRLDFAFLRLDHPVNASRRPAPLFATRPSIMAGERVNALGCDGGVPLKSDDGAAVRDTRVSGDDWFSASTDTSRGSSGGPAFNADGVLLGILARGSRDLEETTSGCNVASELSEDETLQEQYTYAHAAIASLCADDSQSTLCRDQCGSPCNALRPQEESAATSCALGMPTGHARMGATWLLPALLAVARAASRWARCASA